MIANDNAKMFSIDKESVSNRLRSSSDVVEIHGELAIAQSVPDQNNDLA